MKENRKKWNWKEGFFEGKRYLETERGILFCGDVFEILEKLPSESIDCVVTSPPYWRKRDYGVEGQIGLEETFEEYLEMLWRVFDEVYRVLKPAGTLWVNLGDIYANNESERRKIFGNPEFNRGRPSGERTRLPARRVVGVKRKSLCLIPERFAIGMVERGWILRNSIVWAKKVTNFRDEENIGSGMPESVRDRFNCNKEYVYFFVKSERYYFEKPLMPHRRFLNHGQEGKMIFDIYGIYGRDVFEGDVFKGSGCCDVWFMNTEPNSYAHFAVFPEKLPEVCIRAGCPEWICRKCGEPRKRVIKEVVVDVRKPEKGLLARNVDRLRNGGLREGFKEKVYFTAGFAECDCRAGWESGVVLDPFMGSGTTAVVAERLGRRWIGIELNPEYCEIIKERLRDEGIYVEVVEKEAREREKELNERIMEEKVKRLPLFNSRL